MYWGATLVSIAIVGQGEVLALNNSTKENMVLNGQYDFILYDLNNIRYQLVGL